MNAVKDLREGGNSLTSEGDVTDLYRSPPTTGKYKTDLARGMVRLATEPTFPVEADVEGEVVDTSFTDKAGDVIRKVARRHDNMSDPSDVDIVAFNRLTEDADYSVGIATGLAPVTRITLLDKLADSICGNWGFTRNGKLTAEVVDEPSESTTHTITDDNIRLRQIKSKSLPIPTFKQSVGYREQHLVLTDDQLSLSALFDSDSQEQGSVVTNQFRYAESIDDTVKIANPDSEPEIIPTALINREDAKAVADKRMLLYGVPRRLFEVEIIAQLFKHNINESLELRFPRFSLDDGVSFLTTNWSEASGSKVGSEKLVLQLWGPDQAVPSGVTINAYVRELTLIGLVATVTGGGTGDWVDPGWVDPGWVD
jgi:hypothetical protein